VPVDPSRRAVGLERAKGGWRVTVRVEKPSWAEAEKASLALIRLWGDVAAVTLDHEIATGEVLTAADLKR
jgi:hypothetical protein